MQLTYSILQPALRDIWNRVLRISYNVESLPLTERLGSLTLGLRVRSSNDWTKPRQALFSFTVQHKVYKIIVTFCREICWCRLTGSMSRCWPGAPCGHRSRKWRPPWDGTSGRALPSRCYGTSCSVWCRTGPYLPPPDRSCYKTRTQVSLLCPLGNNEWQLFITR